MREEHFLDIARQDFVSRRDHHILLAIHNIEVPFLIDLADIAGAQPAIRRKRGFRFFRAIPVPLHHHRTLNDQFALFVGSERNILTCFQIDDLGINIRQRDADRPLLALAEHRVAVRNRRQFGHTEALHQASAGDLTELLLNFNRQRRGTADTGFDRLQVVLIDAWMIDNADVHRRDAGKER